MSKDTARSPAASVRCGRRFILYSPINRHVVSRHSKEKIYKCTGCGVKFWLDFPIKTHFPKAQQGDNLQVNRLFYMKTSRWEELAQPTSLNAAARVGTF